MIKNTITIISINFPNGQLFEIDDRKYSSITLGTKISRTLSGKATFDLPSTPSKTKLTFTFNNQDDRQYARLKSIFDLHTGITVIDIDNSSRSMFITNDFSSTDDYINNEHNIVLDFEEV